MKKLLVFVPLLLWIIGCGPNSAPWLGSKLSPEEAQTCISQAFDYPKLYYRIKYVSQRQNRDQWDMIRKLINENYVSKITDSQTETFNWQVNEKGMTVIKSLQSSEYEASPVTYNVDIFTCKQTISSIDEVLIDKKSDTAVVNYSVKIEFLEPYASTFLDDEDFRYYNALNPHKQVNLKRYDKGWRIIGKELDVR